MQRWSRGSARTLGASSDSRRVGAHLRGYITIAMPVTARATDIMALKATRPAGLARKPRRELPKRAHTVMQGRLITAITPTMYAHAVRNPSSRGRNIAAAVSVITHALGFRN